DPLSRSQSRQDAAFRERDPRPDGAAPHRRPRRRAQAQTAQTHQEPPRRSAHRGDHLPGARDYLRFFDPRYARSGKLAARAAEYAPSGLASMLERRPALRRHWKLAQRMLALAETVLPPDRYFELFLKAERADLLLVTPLVD